MDPESVSSPSTPPDQRGTVRAIEKVLVVVPFVLEVDITSPQGARWFTLDEDGRAEEAHECVEGLLDVALRSANLAQSILGMNKGIRLRIACIHEVNGEECGFDHGTIS